MLNEESIKNKLLQTAVESGMYDPDTYGMTIEDTIKRFPNGCVEFRPSFGNEFEANHNISLDVISNLKGYKDV